MHIWSWWDIYIARIGIVRCVIGVYVMNICLVVPVFGLVAERTHTSCLLLLLLTSSLRRENCKSHEWWMERVVLQSIYGGGVVAICCELFGIVIFFAVIDRQQVLLHNDQLRLFAYCCWCDLPIDTKQCAVLMSQKHFAGSKNGAGNCLKLRCARVSGWPCLIDYILISMCCVVLSCMLTTAFSGRQFGSWVPDQHKFTCSIKHKLVCIEIIAPRFVWCCGCFAQTRIDGETTSSRLNLMP